MAWQNVKGDMNIFCNILGFFKSTDKDNPNSLHFYPSAQCLINLHLFCVIFTSANMNWSYKCSLIKLAVCNNTEEL